MVMGFKEVNAMRTLTKIEVDSRLDSTLRIGFTIIKSLQKEPHSILSAAFFYHVLL